MQRAASRRSMTREDGMPRRQKKSTKVAMRVGKAAGRMSRPKAGEPLPLIDDLQGRRWRCTDPTSMFSGPRPESFLGGLEPAFVLFDSSVMQALRSRAAERGMEYDTLVRMIVREHVDDY
jgi:hypothetical protein